MADTKISALTEQTILADADLLVSVDISEGVNGSRKITWANVKANTYKTQTFTGQTVIVVNHNLATYPIVQVLDAEQDVVMPLNIGHTSVNSFTVTFSTTTTGTIIYHI